MRGAGTACGLLLLCAGTVRAQSPLHVEHTPPACLVAQKPPVLIACLTPRSARADVRVLFRADEGAWYATSLRYEMPCYRGVLPRPNAGTPRVTYVVEALGGGVTARSAEHAVSVRDSCPGSAPSAPNVRAAWDVPPGAPKTPPGFEGSRVREAAASPSPAIAKTAPQEARPPRPAAAKRAPAAAPEPLAGGGHGFRNAAIVLGGAAAAGGAAVAIRSSGGEAAPPTTTGAGLPAGGVSGTYVGTESVVYSGSCTGTDDVVLNLQESASALSGVLTFTVRTCPCCSAGRGATPISGVLSDTRVDFTTPIGFGYSGTFVGNRLSGSLSGPGGVSGTWTVDKR